MCGICGIAGPGADVEAVRRMNARLVHRGPDSDGEFAADGVALAMRRLSIIDLEHGDQPIANEDGTVTVVQNGEIYNYRELRRELEGRGHRFRTASDTEVLVHLYEEHGEDFAERLRGMFAIAIWDARERRLLLARDRFGIKPLYYRLRDGALSFASELKALLEQPGFSREIDPRAVAAFLAFNSIPAPLTIFAEARKLPPGTLAVWRDGELRQRRYARPAPVPAAETRRRPAAELAEELRETLRGSVRAHLEADVPVGVLLSGGVDSAGLVALAAGEQAEPVKTFSVGFEEASFDELERARLVADRYGAEHHEIVLRPDAVELLPEAGRGLRRALRRLLGAADLPRLRARRGRGQGRPLRRGGRRAVRRLLHLRRRPAGAARRPAGGARRAADRAPAQLRRQGQLRLQSQALRPLGRPAAARAPPGLEGDLHRPPAPGPACRRAENPRISWEIVPSAELGPG